MEEVEGPNRGPSREPYWFELDDADKIERLRSYVREINSLSSRLSRLESRFRRHQHLGTQVVMEYGGGYGDETPMTDSSPRCEKCEKKVRI